MAGAEQHNQARALSVQSRSNHNEWAIDSGAAHHMTGHESCLINAVPTTKIFSGIGGSVTATYKGSVRLRVRNWYGSTSLLLSDVYCVLGQQFNLISTHSLGLQQIFYSQELDYLYQRGDDGERTPYLWTVDKTAEELRAKHGQLEAEMRQKFEELEAQVERMRTPQPLLPNAPECRKVLHERNAEVDASGRGWDTSSFACTIVEMEKELAEAKEKLDSFANRRAKVWL